MTSAPICKELLPPCRHNLHRSAGGPPIMLFALNVLDLLTRHGFCYYGP